MTSGRPFPAPGVAFSEDPAVTTGRPAAVGAVSLASWLLRVLGCQGAGL